jgi:hypothetical protein
MELKQLKQTKLLEKKEKKTETVPDAESKMDDQIEIECTKHAAKDLDEASPAAGRIAMDLNARGRSSCKCPRRTKTLGFKASNRQPQILTKQSRS